MAASAMAIERDFDQALGQTQHLYIGTFTPSSSYPTGGEPFDATSNVRFLKVLTDGGLGGGYVTSWDQANQKLKIFRQRDPAAAGGSDIALPEVTNGVDLSGVTFQFIAVGA
jgi:hypothetical protein